jgi:hypothetical protein
MPAKSETPLQSETVQTLRQLAEVKAIFQQRTIVALLTEKPSK